LDSKQKLKIELEKLEKAYTRLLEALKKDIKKDSIYLDAIIQRFEFTYEIGWKAIKKFLKYEGIECNTPRECIKLAYKAGYINNQEKWLEILEARNLTSHTYSEETALNVYRLVLNDYTAFEELINKLKLKLQEM